jgi:RND family efflux transporter MFP subunit
VGLDNEGNSPNSSERPHGLKTLVLVALAVTTAGLGLAAYRHQVPRPVADDGTVWEPMAFGSLTDAVSATGVLQPREAVAVGTEQAGRVIEVLADLHQSVRKDQPLLRLDDKLARLRHRQAEVAVALASADVVRAEAGRDAARIGVQRAKELLDRVGMQRDLDQAEAQLKAADATVDVARVRVQEAEAALRLAEYGLEVMTVRSPLAGVVIDRKVTAGQLIGPPMSAHLFTVAADPGRMELVAQVAEGDVGRIRPGLRTTFTVNSFPDVTFTGQVTQIKPVPATMQGAVFYSVVVTAENTKDSATGEWRLRPGMPASAELVLRTHENVWKLPAAARGVRLDPARQSEAARKKIAEWDARADRSSWQLVWARDGDAPPRPLYLRLDGKSDTGDSGIQDGQYIEVLAWGADEKPPSADRPPRVLIATPPDKSEKGLKLF